MALPFPGPRLIDLAKGGREAFDTRPSEKAAARTRLVTGILAELTLYRGPRQWEVRGRGWFSILVRKNKSWFGYKRCRNVLRNMQLLTKGVK